MLCDLWLLIGFPKEAERQGLPPHFSFLRLQPPAVGILSGARRTGQGVPRAFIFRQAFTRAKDQSPPVVICISSDRKIFLCYRFQLCSNKNCGFNFGFCLGLLFS